MEMEEIDLMQGEQLPTDRQISAPQAEQQSEDKTQYD